MYQVGLTGGIGSGKTLVCSVFEKLGIPVFYADAEARRLMNSDPGLICKVTELFGEQAYQEDLLNREYLAAQVFGSAEKLAALNALIHPAVRADYLQWVTQQEEVPYVIEEAAILFESGADRLLNTTILVYADEEVRIQRVMHRDKVEEEQVRRRMKHQMDEEEKKSRAEHIIYNHGSEMILPQVIELHQLLVKSI